MATKHRPLDPIRLSYAERTNITVEKSKTDLKKALHQAGGLDVSWLTNDTNTALLFTIGGRRCRFMFHTPQLEDYALTPEGMKRTMVQKHNAHEQALKIVWRAAFNTVKLKLDVIKAGLADVDAEFFIYVVLPDGSTVGENILPIVDEYYEADMVKKLIGHF